jgi:hypothetical protein
MLQFFTGWHLLLQQHPAADEEECAKHILHNSAATAAR